MRLILTRYRFQMQSAETSSTALGFVDTFSLHPVCPASVGIETKRVHRRSSCGLPTFREGLHNKEIDDPWKRPPLSVVLKTNEAKAIVTGRWPSLPRISFKLVRAQGLTFDAIPLSGFWQTAKAECMRAAYGPAKHDYCEISDALG